VLRLFREEYFSRSIFSTVARILFCSKKTEITLFQELVISQLILNESVWTEKVFYSIIDYYKEVYPDYKFGWEIGGMDVAFG